MYSQARTSAVNGMAGGIKAAVALARAEYYIIGNNAAVTVNMDGTLVACAAGTGIPSGTAAGITCGFAGRLGFFIAYVPRPPCHSSLLTGYS